MADALEGTNLTLWPDDQDPATSKVLMYVTVNDKGFPTLNAFSEDERRRTRDEVPGVVIKPTTMQAAKADRSVFSISGLPQGREEMIAYVDGPTKFFIVVITAKSAADLTPYRETFMTFVNGFGPMQKR